MPEILIGSLNITPDQVPPMARGAFKAELLVGSGSPRAAEFLTRAVKDMLYPGWEMYDRDDMEPSKDFPQTYKVFCETNEQAFLARALAPRKATVEIDLAEQVPPDEETDHPFVGFLKSRLGAAINVATTAFAGMTTMVGGSAWHAGDEKSAMIFTGIGSVLTLTSMAMIAVRSDFLPTIEFGRNENRKSLITLTYRN